MEFLAIIIPALGLVLLAGILYFKLGPAPKKR